LSLTIKTLYIIESIIKGVAFGVLFFFIFLATFGLPFVGVTIIPADLLYLQAATILSLASGMFLGAFFGWHLINMHLDFDL
jgi:uncharacterized membrane protein (UPF0136 family)